MNYQGVIVRKDVVWSGVVFWFMVRYYPYLSALLILCMLVSTYWESTTSGMTRVFVNLFRGKYTTTVASGNRRGGIDDDDLDSDGPSRPRPRKADKKAPKSVALAITAPMLTPSGSVYQLPV